MTFEQFAKNLFLVDFLAWNGWCFVEVSRALAIGLIGSL